MPHADQRMRDVLVFYHCLCTLWQSLTAQNNTLCYVMALWVMRCSAAETAEAYLVPYQSGEEPVRGSLRLLPEFCTQILQLRPLSFVAACQPVIVSKCRPTCSFSYFPHNTVIKWIMSPLVCHISQGFFDESSPTRRRRAFPVLLSPAVQIGPI